MEKRVENAINIFLDALNNGTLAKGDCTKCAVGNLVREGCGWTIDEYNEGALESLIKLNGNPYLNWSLVFCTECTGKQRFKRRTYPAILEKYPFIKKQFNSVDFTVEELAKIEKEFEKNTKITYRNYDSYTKEAIRKDQINGLNAVVKVMLSFEENNTDDVKQVFTNKAELIPV